jgi:peroxiredoxin
MSNADQTTQPWLAYDEVIPVFSLPGTDGVPHSPWDYKQREHLVLLFISSSATSEGRDLLRAFARQYRDFREEVCSILVITADMVLVNLQTQETLHLPFPLLSDPQGSVIVRYTYWEDATKKVSPSIVLASRYNALYKQWIAISEVALPPLAELLESLQYINLLCTP